MSRKEKSGIAVLIVAVMVVLGGYCLVRPDKKAIADLEQTRALLQQQGFKIDVNEFNFSTSPDHRERAKIVVKGGEPLPYIFYDSFRPDPRGPDSAVVVWKKQTLQRRSYYSTHPNFQTTEEERAEFEKDLWPGLREELNRRRPVLDAVCSSLQSGPIQFEPTGTKTNPHLPHVSQVKQLSQTLAVRVSLELHDGNKDAAWTNLHALTRLVTAWVPEPMEISHLVRFRCAQVAAQATWQALQAERWSEEQLSGLQATWEEADYFRRLPETMAWARASLSASARQARSEKISDRTGTFTDAIKHTWSLFKDTPLRVPGYVGKFLTLRMQEIGYRRSGTYRDEQALLTYHRDGEERLKNAMTFHHWGEMRDLQGAKNGIQFHSKYSHVKVTMALREMSNRTAGRGNTLLACAAATEAERQMVITAIALTRHKLKFGQYPTALEELVPEFLKKPPLDFMDGKPLRYRLIDGHFVLYSVGLDGVDDGGLQHIPNNFNEPPIWGTQTGFDLVWPRSVLE